MKRVKESGAAFRKKRKMRIEQEKRDNVYRFAASSLFSCCPIILHLGARRGARCHAPSLWPRNKVLKPNFQSIIFQTNNGCSLFHLPCISQASAFRHKLRKYFCIVHNDCITAHPFLIKKCAKMSVLCENRKNLLAAGGYAPRPRWPPGARVFTPRRLSPSPLPKPGCTTGTAYYFCALFLC